MKYFSKICLILLLAGFSVGCMDVVDITQKGTLPPELTFRSVEDMERGLLGVYSTVDIIEDIYWNTVFTDEISIGRGNGGQGLTPYRGQLNVGSGIAEAAWVSGYDVINKATRVIVAAQEIDPGDQQELYNNLLGQAYAIRAFEYFNLLKWFSADITDDASLGVIIFEGIPDITAQLPRSTTGETFQFIMNDLSQAESLISAGFDDVYRFTHQAITALKARMAIYRQNYAQAEQFSQQILDSRDLATPDEYMDMYFEDTVSEVIFKLQRVQGGPHDGQGAVASADGDGWTGTVYAQVSVTEGIHFEVSRSLFNLLSPDDVRYNVISAPERTLDPNYPNTTPEDFYANGINPVNKYRGVPRPLLADQKIFRVSEMVLINAEAKAAQNDLAGAAQMIDQLRQARYMQNAPPAPVYASQEEALTDILKERRVELAFEGHRYFDLRRLGPVTGQTIDRDQLDCSLWGACIAPIEDYKWILPIPEVELNGNPEIQQNPGYGGGSGG